MTKLKSKLSSIQIILNNMREDHISEYSANVHIMLYYHLYHLLFC